MLVDVAGADAIAVVLVTAFVQSVMIMIKTNPISWICLKRSEIPQNVLSFAKRDRWYKTVNAHLLTCKLAAVMQFVGCDHHPFLLMA